MILINDFNKFCKLYEKSKMGALFHDKIQEELFVLSKK